MGSRTVQYKGATIHLSLYGPNGYHQVVTNKHFYTIQNGGKKWYRASSGFGDSYGRNSASALRGCQQLIDSWHANELEKIKTVVHDDGCTCGLCCGW